jgi:hypothetical protein
MVMFKSASVWSSVIGLLLLVAAGPASRPVGGKVFSQAAFSRYTEAGDQPRLETSVFTLKGDDGFSVDLVSAVHIADAAYYRGLNERFKAYDAVLYEMVSAEQNALPPRKGEHSGSPVSAMQRGMKAFLGLTFQLDEVDYSPANFVHADMDVRQFYAAQEARGESLTGLMLKAYLAELSGGRRPAVAGPHEVYKPIDWGNTPESRRRAMKLMFAQTLGDLERMSLQLDGPEGSAILTDRNDACLKVLRQQRAAGKKHLAIFYGAAHMPDMATKLVKVDGLKPAGSEWLVAWDIPAVATTQPTK